MIDNIYRYKWKLCNCLQATQLGAFPPISRTVTMYIESKLSYIFKTVIIIYKLYFAKKKWATGFLLLAVYNHFIEHIYTRSLSNVRWFYGKNAKFGMEISQVFNWRSIEIKCDVTSIITIIWA